MKRFLLFIWLLSFSMQLLAQDGIPPKPNPPRLVNDFANLLSSLQVKALEDKLKLYDDSTSNQITIVTTNNIGNYEISDYALQLGRAWGVGGKQYNNGIVLVVLKDDVNKRRKVWIATGYGLEGAIPDITAKRIIDAEIVPRFRENDIYRGLENGTDALIRAAAGEYKAPEGYNKRGKKGGSPLWIFLVIFIVIIIISNSGGGKNGGMMSRRGYRGWTGPLLWGGLGGLGGGGGSSGGGGGGGGFGGFGGGSFGGGGAGGDW
jgi:uncharacterized protein